MLETAPPPQARAHAHTHTLTPHQRLAGHRSTREPHAPVSSCSSRFPPQDVLLELPGQGAYTAGLQPHAGSFGLAQQYKKQPSPTPKRINSGGKLVRNGCTYPGAGTLTVTSEEVTHCSPRSLRRGDEHSMTRRCRRDTCRPTADRKPPERGAPGRNRPALQEDCQVASKDSFQTQVHTWMLFQYALQRQAAASVPGGADPR